jgi:hypothetical protein
MPERAVQQGDDQGHRAAGYAEGKNHQPAEPARHAATPSGAGMSVMSLQRKVGNRAVVSLLDRQSDLQRVKWPDDPSGRKTKAELSAELRQGVESVKAKPGAPPPNEVVAWARERTKENFKDVAKLDPTELGTSIESAWGKAKTSMLAKDKSRKEADVKEEFFASRRAAAEAKNQEKFNKTVDAYMRDTALKELKWGEPFRNKDGDLPGDKGAGGYAEYYAKPAASDAVEGGFWGQNRVLKANSGAWYVTADHYINYSLVTDA